MNNISILILSAALDIVTISLTILFISLSNYLGLITSGLSRFQLYQVSSRFYFPPIDAQLFIKFNDTHESWCKSADDAAVLYTVQTGGNMHFYSGSHHSERMKTKPLKQCHAVYLWGNHKASQMLHHLPPSVMHPMSAVIPDALQLLV